MVANCLSGSRAGTAATSKFLLFDPAIVLEGPAATASVPIPTFVFPCGTLRYQRRNQRDTSKFMILVWLLDLTFLYEVAAIKDRNVKSATLASACANKLPRRSPAKY